MWKFQEFSWVSYYANKENFHKYKQRNTFLMRNTNKMKALNMKRTKPKTYKGEMSFWIMKMTIYENLLSRCNYDGFWNQKTHYSKSTIGDE